MYKTFIKQINCSNNHIIIIIYNIIILIMKHLWLISNKYNVSKINLFFLNLFIEYLYAGIIGCSH